MEQDGSPNTIYGSAAKAIELADRGVNIKRIVGASGTQWQELEVQLGVPFCKKVSG